jgi:hypothetical protein
MAMASLERRRRYDPFVIACCLICLLCFGGTVFVSGTVLDSKRKVDDSVCAQVRSYMANRDRERRLARVDAPVTRPAHRQSARAFDLLLEEVGPLVDCPDDESRPG